MRCYYTSFLTLTRAPKLPLECYHGNSYTERVEVVRGEDGHIEGLHLKLLVDGKLLEAQ